MNTRRYTAVTRAPSSPPFPLLLVNLLPGRVGALQVLFQNHIEYIGAKDTGTFMTLMHLVHEGLQAMELPLSNNCASAIDYLATYFFQNRDKDWPAVRQLQAHIGMDSSLIPSLMATLFNQLLFGPYSNHWVVTRPILSLMLADEASFNAFREHLASSQSPENQVMMAGGETR